MTRLITMSGTLSGSRSVPLRHGDYNTPSHGSSVIALACGASGVGIRTAGHKRTTMILTRIHDGGHVP